MKFWNGLDARERLLITIAGCLVLILAIWFLGVRPIMSAKSNAQTAQSMALRDLEIVQTNVSKLSSGSSVVSGTQPFDRNAVIQIAKTNNLNISRVQPENNGSLKVWFDEASSRQVFKFMSELTSEYAAQIAGVQMTRKDSGSINATITLKGSRA